MSNVPGKIIEFINGEKEGHEISVGNFGQKFKLDSKKTTAEIQEIILNLQKKKNEE